MLKGLINDPREVLRRSQEKEKGKETENEDLIKRNIIRSSQAFSDHPRYKRLYPHPEVYKSALREHRPNRKDEEAEEVLMKHAFSILAKCEYDPEEKAVDDTFNLVSEHYKRRLDDRVK